MLQKYMPEIEQIVSFAKLGYDRQLVTAAGGNVSLRCCDGVLITATGVSLRSVTPNDILLVDLDGNILYNPNGLRPSKETRFHLAILRARRSVNAVYHVHPPYVTAYTVAQRELPRVTSGAINKLCPAIMLRPMRSGSDELSDAVEAALQQADEKTKAIILSQHGIVAFDERMEEAFNIAELMEDCARIAYLSEQMQLAAK